jgi:protein gp37
MGSAKYQNDGDPRTSGPGFGAAMHPDALGLPLTWRKPRRIFVNSMSDLFHEKFTDEFIARVLAVMATCPQHTFQILTKRHARMRSFLRDECQCGSQHPAGVHVNSAMHWAATPHSPTYVPGVTDDAVRRAGWPLRNVWMGVSTEDQKWADIRIPALLDTPAAVRFLSCEPLLGPVNLAKWMPGGFARWQCGGCRRYFSGELENICPSCDREGYWSGSHTGNGRPNGQPISWIIVGGESGPGARPMHPDWVRALRDQCTTAGVAFHFKQWGNWAPAWDRPLLGDVWVRPDGSTRPWEPSDGHTRSGLSEFRDWQEAALMRRAAKKVAGRELDGRTWDEFPAGVVS